MRGAVGEVAHRERQDLARLTGGVVGRDDVVPKIPQHRLELRVAVDEPEDRSLHPQVLVELGRDVLFADRLDADLTKKVGDLSTGNRQKVGLIQAFMNRPALLIMDEPSTGLDPLVQREFQAMMREVASEGRTVFLSSHTLSEVQRVSDRVGIIRHGLLVAVETVQALRSKAMRRVEFEFATHVDPTVFDGVPGVRDVSANDHRIVLSYDGKMDSLLTTVAGRYEVVDIATAEADLEEIFLTYYRDEEVAV